MWLPLAWSWNWFDAGIESSTVPLCVSTRLSCVNDAKSMRALPLCMFRSIAPPRFATRTLPICVATSSGALPRADVNGAVVHVNRDRAVRAHRQRFVDVLRLGGVQRGATE